MSKNIENELEEQQVFLKILKGVVYEISEKEAENFEKENIYKVSGYNDNIVIFDFDKNSIKPMVEFLLRGEEPKESNLMIIIGVVFFLLLVFFGIYSLIFDSGKTKNPATKKIKTEVTEVSNKLETKEKKIKKLELELKLKEKNNLNSDVLKNVSSVENKNIELLNTIDNLKFSLENQKNNFDFRIKNITLQKNNLELKLENCKIDLEKRKGDYKKLNNNIIILQKEISNLKLENEKIKKEKNKIEEKLYQIVLNTKGSISELEKYFGKIIVRKCLKNKKLNCQKLFDKFYNDNLKK